jgi:hypothetical protein
MVAIGATSPSQAVRSKPPILVLGQRRQGRGHRLFREHRELRRLLVPVYLDRQIGRFTAAIPSWAGIIRQSVFHRCLSLCTTETIIMISRADGGRNQRDPAGGRDHAASRHRNRSGPVAGGGVSLRPPRMARVVPGHRPAHFADPRSGPTTVIAVEQCELSATERCGGVIW